MADEKYERANVRGLLIRGDLRGAVEYISHFPEKSAEHRRYMKRFERGVLVSRTDNECVCAIDKAYQKYYIDVFWRDVALDTAQDDLCASLAALLGGSAGSAIDELEEKAEKVCEGEGFHFLGGSTSGRLGPYIWKSTEAVDYDVLLPDGHFTFTVNMMDGFVSRSWLDYISFGKIGTGGWASGTDGQLSCVRKLYKKDFGKPSFEISFLKHEGQHAHDRERFGEVMPADLEYRAKLVELIYYPNMRLLKSFLASADGSDKTNSHTYAEYALARGLSEKVLGTAVELDFTKWKGRAKKVRSAARELLDEHTARLCEERAKSDGVIGAI